MPVLPCPLRVHHAVLLGGMRSGREFGGKRGRWYLEADDQHWHWHGLVRQQLLGGRQHEVTVRELNPTAEQVERAGNKKRGKLEKYDLVLS